MAKYKKDETSPEALQRVVDTNIVFSKGIRTYSEFQDELENNIPKGLKDVFKGDLKDELTNDYYKDYLKNEVDNLPKNIGESDAKYKKRNDKYVSALNKERDKFKIERGKTISKAQLKKMEQQRLEEFKPTYQAPKKIKQKTSGGKVYSRSYLNWNKQQLRFIQSRTGRKGYKEIVNEYNNHFPVERTLSSIKTKLLRLKKLNKK